VERRASHYIGNCPAKRSLGPSRPNEGEKVLKGQPPAATNDPVISITMVGGARQRVKKADLTLGRGLLKRENGTLRELLQEGTKTEEEETITQGKKVHPS